MSICLWSRPTLPTVPHQGTWDLEVPSKPHSESRPLTQGDAFSVLARESSSLPLGLRAPHKAPFLPCGFIPCLLGSDLGGH